MIQKHGNIWFSGADIICVTTNGMTDSRGCAVMGGGIAAKAKRYYPSLPRLLGERLKAHGNHVFAFDLIAPEDFTFEPQIVTFPTKNDWQMIADLDLITQSARELVDFCNSGYHKRVAIPKPGCGLGMLDWNVVKPRIEGILADDKFEIWSF